MQRHRGKITEWDRLEISSSKLEIPRAFHAKMSTVKGRNGWTKKKEMDGPKRSRIDEEVPYSQQKQDQELTVAQIMNPLLSN